MSLTDPYPALDLALLEFELEMLEPTRLEGFVGPSLRGMLGDAMMAAPSPQHLVPDAPGTHLLELVFKPPRGPQHQADPTPPFVLHPPRVSNPEVLPGETLRFGLVLINSAVPLAISVLQALVAYGERSMLPQQRTRSFPPAPSTAGFTRARRAFRVRSVRADTPLGTISLFALDGAMNVSSWRPEWTFSDSVLVERNLKLEDAPQRRLELRLTTPLHLQERGVPVPVLSFQHLVRALLRNVAAHSSPSGRGTLTLQVGDFLERADGVRLLEDRRCWRTVRRRSRTQRREIPVEAPVGSLCYEGDLEPFLPLLTLGRVLHVGKARSSGFGGIDWR